MLGNGLRPVSGLGGCLSLAEREDGRVAGRTKWVERVKSSCSTDRQNPSLRQIKE